MPGGPCKPIPPWVKERVLPLKAVQHKLHTSKGFGQTATHHQSNKINVIMH